jgi:hypothetical protein
MASASSTAPAPPPAGVPVTVNIYTLMNRESRGTRVSNDVLDFVGMSIYHAGIEVFDKEYAFGMDPSQRPDPNIDGIFAVPPRKAVGDFKEAVVVGHLPNSFTPRDLKDVLERLRPVWRAVTYHILERNCCHFAKDFVLALNPSFEKTFPHYVCRIASVGTAVVPDALVAKITAMVAPPPAIPPNLINVVDVAYDGPAPPPRPAPVTPTTPAKSPGSGPGGFFKSAGLAIISASKFVGDAVGNLATESDRRTFAAKFPGVNASNLRKNYTTSVSYCFREYEAELFIATDCVCLTGPPQLQIVIPMSDIASIQPARFAPPLAPRLPPQFELLGQPATENPAVFIFRQSRPNAVTPLFKMRSFGSGLSEKVGGVPLTLEVLKLLERLWYESKQQ